MSNKPIGSPIDADTLRRMLAASGTGLWDWRINEDAAYYSDEWLAIVGTVSKDRQKGKNRIKRRRGGGKKWEGINDYTQ